MPITTKYVIDYVESRVIDPVVVGHRGISTSDLGSLTTDGVLSGSCNKISHMI